MCCVGVCSIRVPEHAFCDNSSLGLFHFCKSLGCTDLLSIISLMLSEIRDS